MSKKITVRHRKGPAFITAVTANTTKKITSTRHRSCTFAELWNTLSINYARNRRDIVSAYGGSEYYHQIDLLYRQGITADASSAEETLKTTNNAPLHKNPDNPTAKPVSITAYFTPASPSATGGLPGPPLSANDNEKTPNNAIIKLIIFTNELLSSQDKWIIVKNAYQRGIFYAILTLKRTNKEEALPMSTTKNWQNASLFRLTLSAAPQPPSPDFDGSLNFAQFYAFNASNSAYVTTKIEQDEDMDNVFLDKALDNGSDSEDIVHENQGDNRDDMQHDNVNNSVKKSARFGGSVSTPSYRFETYKHFFSHFFYATKGLANRKQFLADFF